MEKKIILIKKIYEKPVMQAEVFVANNYCSNCTVGPT